MRRYLKILLVLLFAVGVSPQIFLRSGIQAEAAKAVTMSYEGKKELRLASGTIRQNDKAKLVINSKIRKKCTKIRWKSSNSKIASVSSSGVVTAKRVGTCTITTEYTYKKKRYRVKTSIKVVSRWDAEKRKFPNGKYWNSSNEDKYTNYPCSHHLMDYYGSYTLGCDSPIVTCSIAGEISRGTQCHGFALKVAMDVYGEGNLKKWKKTTKFRRFKEGDIIRWNSHTIIVTGAKGNTIYFADCNRTGLCRISWKGVTSLNTLKNGFRYAYIRK